MLCGHAQYFLDMRNRRYNVEKRMNLKPAVSVTQHEPRGGRRLLMPFFFFYYYYYYYYYFWSL
jgi:hypothetical protein